LLALEEKAFYLHNAAAEKQCVLPDPATVSTDDAAAPPAVSQPR
jgi:hypothetical protein